MLFSVNSFQMVLLGNEIYDAMRSILSKFSLLNIVKADLRPMAGANMQWNSNYWFLTDFGKELVQYLAKLGIEVIEVKIEDNHGCTPTMLIVDAIFKPNKRMQISKVSLEWTENMQVEFDSSSVKLPFDTDINKHIELKYQIRTHSDNWYILWEGKQGFLAPNKRAKGRLIVTADGEERESEIFFYSKIQ